MCLMFVIIFFKKIMQRTNTKGFEDKQLHGEQITYTCFTHIITHTVVDKLRKILWSDYLGLPGNFIFDLILGKMGDSF